MKKVFLKKYSCSYCKKKRDVSGRTPSSVANDAVGKAKCLSSRTLNFNVCFYQRHHLSLTNRNMSTFLKSFFVQSFQVLHSINLIVLKRFMKGVPQRKFQEYKLVFFKCCFIYARSGQLKIQNLAFKAICKAIKMRLQSIQDV